MNNKNLQNKIIFLCLTTEKYANRRENILKTWGKNVDLLFYSEHEDEESKVVKVCDVNNAEVKQCSVFQYIRDNNLSYDWYFFCDDDTFVNTNLLIVDLETFDENCVTGYDNHGSWRDSNGHLLHYPSGGAGFLVPKKIIHNFFNVTSYNTIFGDVSVGLEMQEKKIPMCHNGKFLRLRNDDEKWGQSRIELKNVKNYYTFHYIDTYERMNLLYTNCH